MEQAERFTMRVAPDFLRGVDEWRRLQPDIPGRSEAIRRLVARGLADTVTFESLAELLIRMQGMLDEGRLTTEEAERVKEISNQMRVTRLSIMATDDNPQGTD